MDKRYLTPIPVLILSGCSSAEEKIVDLSAVVFCLYVFMIGLKYGSRIMVDSAVFAKIARFIQSHLARVIIPIYIVAAALIAAGFYFSGIHRIFIFIGLALAVIGYHASKLVRAEISEDRELSIEVVSLGIGIVVVQIMMWHYGPDLFEPF